jgi:hypothetical protein
MEREIEKERQSQREITTYRDTVNGEREREREIEGQRDKE